MDSLDEVAEAPPERADRAPLVRAMRTGGLRQRRDGGASHPPRGGWGDVERQTDKDVCPLESESALPQLPCADPRRDGTQRKNCHAPAARRAAGGNPEALLRGGGEGAPGGCFSGGGGVAPSLAPTFVKA